MDPTSIASLLPGSIYQQPSDCRLSMTPYLLSNLQDIPLAPPPFTHHPTGTSIKSFGTSELRNGSTARRIPENPSIRLTRSSINQSFYRLRTLQRRIKKAVAGATGDGDDIDSTASGSPSGASEVIDDGVYQPLFCDVCRVRLNAPTQAKQHYNGKNHARRIKLFGGRLESSLEVGQVMQVQVLYKL